MSAEPRTERRTVAPTPPPLDVLVVDDDEPTLSAVAIAVRALGHAVRTAATAEEALQRIAERRPDVVFSDYQLPGMSGTELCARARAMAPSNDEAPYVYFVVVTGHDDRSLELEVMRAGADDFQRKPIDLVQLEARLVSAERVVRLHRRLAEQATMLRRESRQLYVAARTDALTGVGNRLALHDEMALLRARASRYEHRYAVAICDIDLFKTYNDRFGHVAGDEALRRVADAIRATVRAGDGIYRFGGEEFVILFPEQTLAQAAHAMERVRAAVEALALPAPSGGVLTVSAGVAEVESKDRTPEDWLSRADAALYEAKETGRNRVEATPSPHPT